MSEVVLHLWLATAGGVEQLADIRSSSRTLSVPTSILGAIQLHLFHPRDSRYEDPLKEASTLESLDARVLRQINADLPRTEL